MIERVLFAGGGTGGHIFMAVAIAEELKKRQPEVQILFVGAGKGLEERILAPYGFPLEVIKLGGLKNVGFKQTVQTLGQLPSSFWKSRTLLKRFRPSVLVGLGGYSSGPVLLMGSLMGIPSLLVEPNRHPGFTNRMLSRWVDGAAVAFEETGHWFRGKSHLTGIPVRKEFYGQPKETGGGGPLRLLIFGGSQGSRAINSLVCEALPHLTAEKIRIIHQTGPLDYRRTLDCYEKYQYQADVLDFIHDMPDRFSQADLLITRAGALTLAEITAAGKAAILIPFPFAADQHQKKNARALESRGAAVVLEESQTSGKVLAECILGLDRERNRLKQMSDASSNLAVPDSAHRMIQVMEEVAIAR